METTPDGEPIQLTNIVIHPAGPTLAVAIANNVKNSMFGIEWAGSGLSGFSNAFAGAAKMTTTRLVTRAPFGGLTLALVGLSVAAWIATVAWARSTGTGPRRERWA